MGEYGQWLKVHRPQTDEQVAEVQNMLRQTLARALNRDDLDIVPWDLEARYGRERLHLTDEQQAVGVHVVIDDG